MGRVYAPPKEIGDPPALDFKASTANILATFQAYEQRIVEWCKQHGSGPEAGSIVRFPVADGQASYVIESLKPVRLIHVPTGDAYQFAYVDRLTANDLRERLDRERSIAEIFRKP